ncbi:uncharacterized protein LOC102808581 [Saccoglossus kowalevskii]|uniref:Coiled-coil domain-containing protein 178-like n=1 Tax=Saccoglossus kowalevskii TaxID=10224 RepID=A0ABM0MQW9_SACKO|nr:PREDICTED: coiled-coil domain-containing protein 178-like [Saccoglossus kowalevskii]
MPTISNSSVRSDLPTRERLTAVSNELATSTSKTGSSSDVERFSAFGKTSTTASQSKRTSVVSRSDTKGFTDVSEVDRLSDEEQDQLLPLPQGWPRLQDQIFRRRALSFKKPVSTSIDHAISHIQKLQDRLEEWARDVEFEIMSRKTNSSCATSVCCSNRDSATSARERTVTDTRGSDRRHIRFAPTSAASVEASESTLESRQSENVTDLSIQGIGAIMPPGLEMEIEAEIPTLGAEEVIDETVTLLGRLETDRRDTADRLEEEKKRSDMLRARIDKLAEKRMYELPLAVQHEHEACALDISELQWHVAYRGRQEARIRSKVDIAEVLNSRLLEDINFVKTHSPLVEEKLELELEAMHKIQDAQMQTNDELAKTVEKLKQTESKSEEAHGKAEMERAHIKKELDTVRQALHEISTELDEARKTFTSYTQQCDDSRRKLQDNVQEQIVLETKNENARAAEKMQGKKVKQVKEKIVEAEFEHRKLKDENTKMASDKDSRSTILKKEDNEMEYEAQSKLSTLRETQHKNKEMKMEIEDIGEKLAAW